MVNSLKVSMPASKFGSLEAAPVDEIFTLNAQYIADDAANKVNLAIGVYRTEDGHSWPLPAVDTAEQLLTSSKNHSRHDYLAIQGDIGFLRLARDLCFGFPHSLRQDHACQSLKNRITSVQTISGTGANHLGASFVSRTINPARVWIPDPTWMNHHAIWELTGVKKALYPYYDAKNKCFDFEGAVHCLTEQAETGDVVVLHACAHNPTGADPTKQQWVAIADLCERKGLFPFFDLAYQGFASGNPDEDSWAIQHFLKRESRIEFCVAQSFSKNFGLYGQRVGALHFVNGSGSSEVNAKILSNLCHIVRGEFSMAPRAGSDLVRTVLEDVSLRKLWLQNIIEMSSRIKEMRQTLYEELCFLGTPGTWMHIISQIGMFSYTGLTSGQSRALREKHHIYLLESGRMSISGLNRGNVSYVARAIDDVVRHVR